MMHHSTRVIRRPRRAWPLTARAAAAIIAIAGLSLLAVGCGGGGHSSTTSAGYAQASGTLAVSRCMRSHGVSSFPDPNSSGQIPKAQVASLASSPQFQVAQRACQHLLPNTNPPTDTHAEVQAALSGMVRFAACMRSHRVQNWPDPTVDRHHTGDPRPVFDLHSIADPNSPQISADIHECQPLMPQSTAPYMCSALVAQRIGGPPGAEACFGGSARVP